MLFILHALDHPDAAERRLANYDAHKAHAASAPASGISVKLGGPLLATGSHQMIGSFALYEAPERCVIDKFIDQDPFNRSGVWAEVHLHPFDARIRPRGLFDETS